MHFCNKRNFHPDPTVTIYNSQIPVVSQTKFLGVLFDSKLNFKADIDYICQKCEKAMNLPKVVAKIDWRADRSVLMTLYGSLFILDWNMVVLFLVLHVSFILRNWIPLKTKIENMPSSLQDFSNARLYVEANEPLLYLKFDYVFSML